MAELIISSTGNAALRQAQQPARYGTGHVWRAVRNVAIALLPFAFALLGFAPASAEASNVRFVGNGTYSYSGNVVVLTADEVSNTDTFGYSGTLRLELWALAAPYQGGAFTGYKLAEYALGQLSAGYAYFNVNTGSIPFTYPPNGTWRFVLFVTEYVAGPVDDGYAVDDWINFANPVQIGPPPPPPPPPPGVTPQIGLWWNPNESGSGYALDYKHGVLVVTIYSYTTTGGPQWYLASGPLSGSTFTSTLDKYVAGQCIACAYFGRPSLAGNDGTITIVFSSPTSATVYLPGGRVTQIQPQAF